MAEETAKQLRCIMIYELLGHRNAYGNPTAYYEPGQQWFVSLELAKRSMWERDYGLWFEVEPYWPCLAFRFDSKWLFVKYGDLENVHVEQEGKILRFDLWDKSESICWQEKTLEQLREFFYSLDVYHLNEGYYGMVKTIESTEATTIQEASCMATATQESFWSFRTNWGWGWHRTQRKWLGFYEDAKKLDTELAKFSLDDSEVVVDQYKSVQEPQIKIQESVENRREIMELEKSVLLWKEGSPNIEDFKENEQCLVTIMNQLAMFTKRGGEWIMGGDSAFGGYRKVDQDTAKLVTRFCPVVDTTNVESGGNKIFSKLQWYQGPLDIEEFEEGDQCLVLVNNRRLLWLIVMNGRWHIRHSGTMYADSVETDESWIRGRCFLYCPIRPNESRFIDLWRGGK